MDARTWRFLRAEKAEAYTRVYEKKRNLGWKSLKAATTQRQFHTACDILDRLNSGTEGVLLADDVGLGKTTVATLCALVIAGKQGRVRILAPNEMMARRWRHEIEIHVGALTDFAKGLDLTAVGRNLGANVSRLTQGQIAVSTHAKAGQLGCDLLIVDEAHRARSEHSHLASAIGRQRKDIRHLIVLTATPFSIDSRDLGRLLARVGADPGVINTMGVFAKQLDDLWKGRAVGDPVQLAAQLARAARAAVEAMRPYVIRHGISDLTSEERSLFGEFLTCNPRSVIGEPMLEAMLRADRALLLGRRAEIWQTKRRNDPRYHVARGKLLADLGVLHSELLTNAAPDASHALVHVAKAIECLEKVPIHPKIEATVSEVARITSTNEKVLVFCDHHMPAGELAIELARRLSGERSSTPDIDVWMQAWNLILRQLGKDAKPDDKRMRENFLEWLCSEGLRAQVTRWLGNSLHESTEPEQLKSMLEGNRARGNISCASITDHAQALYDQLTDPTSASTRAKLQTDWSTLPGANLSNVCAVCDVPQGADELLFFDKQPDTVLAIFNSPFGPDVLVTTDKLSEGVDLHRFCRHLIHHELDPSPVRTVQRNGRLRRVDSWASKTSQPIVISYPALEGTRDERVVDIMQMRLRQFDLLLGGVGQDIAADDGVADEGHTLRILAEAQKKMGKLRLNSV